MTNQISASAAAARDAARVQGRFGHQLRGDMSADVGDLMLTQAPDTGNDEILWAEPDEDSYAEQTDPSADAAYAAIERVQRMHQNNLGGHCVSCGTKAPCPTITALDGLSTHQAAMSRARGVYASKTYRPEQLGATRTDEQIRLDAARESRDRARFRLGSSVDAQMDPYGLQIGDEIVDGPEVYTVKQLPQHGNDGAITVKTSCEWSAALEVTYPEGREAKVRRLAPETGKIA